MRPIFLIATMTLSLSLAAIPADAQTTFTGKSSTATLVELYSSEGCSSCPPAEDWVSHLKTAPGLWTEVFPVAFHVDYWDGLGWPDRFARAEYTQRQRNYAAQLGQDSVYTPEFVVAGNEWRGWFHGERQPRASAPTRGELNVTSSDGGKKISAVYTPVSLGGSQSYTINVALLGMGVVSDVKRGENSGRSLTHDFVVLDFTSKPMSAGANFQSGPMELKPATGDSPGAIVAWVSDAAGSIVQVAGGWLKPSDGSAQASSR